MDQTLTQNVDTLFANMETFAQKEGLIGKAVTQGDKTFMPILSVTLGYGGGDTTGKTPQNTKGIMGNTTTSQANATPSTGGALGLGARISTDAVIVIDKDTVSVVHVSSSGSLSNQMIEKIPEIISNMNTNKNSTTATSMT